MPVPISTISLRRSGLITSSGLTNSSLRISLAPITDLLPTRSIRGEEHGKGSEPTTNKAGH